MRYPAILISNFSLTQTLAVSAINCRNDVSFSKLITPARQLREIHFKPFPK